MPALSIELGTVAAPQGTVNGKSGHRLRSAEERFFKTLILNSAEDLTTDDHLLALMKRMPASSTATHDSPFE
jgi:hypothetical protein